MCSATVDGNSTANYIKIPKSDVTKFGMNGTPLWYHCTAFGWIVEPGQSQPSRYLLKQSHLLSLYDLTLARAFAQNSCSYDYIGTEKSLFQDVNMSKVLLLSVYNCKELGLYSLVQNGIELEP